MNLFNPRLWQATSAKDFLFRLRYKETDNQRRRMQVREVAGLARWKESNGWIAFDIAPFVEPDKRKFWGPDLSDWDGNVNMLTLANHGASFVIIKAMDGTVPMRYWEGNNYRAKEVGLLNSSYAWLYPDKYVSCKAQAQAYWNLIKDAGLKLPPAVDFEWTRYNSQTANPNYSDLDKWVTEFIRVSGIKPILYSAAGYMFTFGRMPDELRKKFSGFWWASYGGVAPLYPLGFNTYDVWQFTSFGDAQTLAPGDRGKKELDLNYATESFIHLTDNSQPSDEETGESMPTVTYWQGVAPSNIDTWNDINKPKSGAIRAGATIRGNAKGATWTQLTSPACFTKSSFLGSWYKQVPVTTPDEPPVTPPADVHPVEATVTMSDGSVWKSTEWTKQ